MKKRVTASKPSTSKPGARKSEARAKGRSHSDAIDEQLARYREMRDFNVTAEPKGGPNRTAKAKAAESESQLPFVIQKHAATRLHYDFRLGWRGVLKSWAVTKGPSYYPGDKRLAVQVEDHPMEYGGFEGIIPKGQYGGGTVMLWDEGTWTPHGDADEGLEKGRLKFTLHGKKLHGNWALIRMGGKAANEKKSNWLLIKEHDEYERSESDPCVTVEEPDSVVTGRDLEAIAESQDHVWGSQGSLQEQKTVRPSPSSQKKSLRGARVEASRGSAKNPVKRVLAAAGLLQTAPKGTLPDFVPPQLSLQVSEAPEGPEWIYELKLDGYRIQGRIDQTRRGSASRVKLITRSGLDWTHRMPEIERALEDIPAESALFDGEVVVFDERGGTSFALLQASFQDGKKQQLTYVVFDLLHLNGRDLRGLSLEHRKQLLQDLLAASEEESVVRFSEHLGIHGKEIFQNACKLGAEGIVSKRISAPYTSGRSGTWLKIKCIRQQEFVIGGFTLPSKTGVGIGALLLGYYRDGQLIYAGRTGTGFTQKIRKSMRAVLEKIVCKKTLFASLPQGVSRQAIWVEPKLVCEVKFATWTADNLVRQASFQGLREDKPAKDVKREVPIDLEEAAMPKRKPDVKDSVNANDADRVRKATSTSTPRRKVAPNVSKVASRKVEFPIALTHPDKQVDSETRLTKRELADYFWAVRDHMLPYISERPLSIVRCPQGSTKPCFFQKHVTDNLPEGIEGIEIRGRRSGVVESYITLSTPLGLAGLAQMGVLEIHPWGSSNGDIEKPDTLIFDLDPDEAISWKTLTESAQEVRARLKQCKLESFLKTTGGKGLHIVAPIEPQHDWPVVKDFAHEFALRMEADNKQLYLTKMTKAARKGKIFIDYLRNDRGATSIALYSPRARHGAPVAVPLDWNELDAPQVPRFLVADFESWKDRLRHDPWKRMLGKRQAIPADILAQFTSGRGSDSRHSERKD
ncbi:MAG: DNA ligase D [Acidobacteriaceae bacterium]